MCCLCAIIFTYCNDYFLLAKVVPNSRSLRHLQTPRNGVFLLDKASAQVESGLRTSLPDAVFWPALTLEPRDGTWLHKGLGIVIHVHTVHDTPRSRFLCQRYRKTCRLSHSFELKAHC